MPRLLLHLLLLFVVSSTCTAQPTGTDAVRTGNILNRMQTQNGLSPGDLIIPPASTIEHEVEGNPYWDSHWSGSALQFYAGNRWVTGYSMRYNIYRNDFEFLIDKSIRVVDGNQIRNMVFEDSLSRKTRFLINAKDYREDDIPLTGFFEVLVDGKNALLKHIRLEILKPDFNPALNVGRKNTRIVKKEAYFFNMGGVVHRIKSRKSFEPLFENRRGEFEAFVKNEGLKYNREADLIKLFHHFSSSQENLEKQLP